MSVWNFLITSRLCHSVAGTGVCTRWLWAWRVFKASVAAGALGVTFGIGSCAVASISIGCRIFHTSGCVCQTGPHIWVLRYLCSYGVAHSSGDG